MTLIHKNIIVMIPSQVIEGMIEDEFFFKKKKKKSSTTILMKVRMAVRRTKMKLRQSSQQESTEDAKSPQFKRIGERRLARFKKIRISTFPTCS